MVVSSIQKRYLFHPHIIRIARAHKHHREREAWLFLVAPITALTARLESSIQEIKPPPPPIPP